MWELINKVRTTQTILLFLLLSQFIVGCKEKEKEYLYELQEVKIKQAGANKNAAKTDLEFVSLVYSDLFGKTISQDELTTLITTYNSYGDKAGIVDMVIRDFLTRPDVKIPTDTEMRQNPEKFVVETYKKFYIREPGEYEKYYLVNLINKDPKVSPALIYYTFLTSNEYKFY